MPRRGPARATALAVAALLVLGGCGSAATPSPTPASATPTPFPEASFTGGTASAGLVAPVAAQWSGGWCQRGAEDAWLALNIGYPNGSEYFGLVAGHSPFTPDATRDAAGGGAFGGDDAIVTWRHAGTPVRVAAAGLEVRLLTDLSGGSFRGRLPDGSEVRGSFSC